VEVGLITFFQIALIITSLALILSVVLQNKGVGLGGLTGQDLGAVYSQRRGIEKTLFWVTIILGIVFVILVIATIAMPDLFTLNLERASSWGLKRRALFNVKSF
jgi:preprotein translocase subunit SecG